LLKVWEERKKGKGEKKNVEGVGWVKNVTLKSALVKAEAKGWQHLPASPAVRCSALQPGPHFGRWWW